MYDNEIRRLSSQFYMDFPHSLYPEILTKISRNYNIVVFEITSLKNYYICIPFRSEMKHKNGYTFRHSQRSKMHYSGLDFSKLVIIKNRYYLGDKSRIDFDEYEEFKRNKDVIHKKIEKCINDYINHYKGIKVLKQRDFNRKYQYSTLKYFHKELGI